MSCKQHWKKQAFHKCDTSCPPVTAKSKSPTWHPIPCPHINACPFWNIILALHFYLLYNHLYSFFDAIPAPLLALWPLLPACTSLLYHPEQIKFPCPPLLLQNVSTRNKLQGTLLRSYAHSEAHSKSGSVYKAWESTTHVSSSGMVLQVWNAFPSPTFGMSRCVLLPQSFSSKAHKSWKDKTVFILSLLLALSHHSAHHLFCLYFISLNSVLLHACEMPNQSTNTVPAVVSQRNYWGAQDQSQEWFTLNAELHAFIPYLLFYYYRT